MRKWILLLMFFYITAFSKAQIFDDRQIDNIVLKIPIDKTISTDNIAEYVKQNFDSEIKKVRAVYSWITSNIKYSTDSANIINLGLNPYAKISEALRRRKGVCENYAALFNDICLKTGLTSFIIDGYTKQGGAVDKTGHNWCAVFINNEWQLCDPTWDAGANGNFRWFMLPPSEMIASHMPYDPMWQFLSYPVSHHQFYSGNIYENKKQSFFNYADTINAYIKMDSLQKFRSSAYRIEQSELYNGLIKDRLNYTKMQIEMIRQDKDVELYNSAVADLNDAAIIYNDFVQFRNKQFTPAIADTELKLLLDGINAKLLDGNAQLDKIAKSAATFTFSTDAVRNKLKSMEVRVKEQKDFLNIYINTAKDIRASLFYNKQFTAGK
ncbi:MAG: hypothetical protein M3004_10660 [Bacteroidota bacterium]|nr:hypothetical protein [Bacteroidota bacterium]